MNDNSQININKQNARITDATVDENLYKAAAGRSTSTTNTTTTETETETETRPTTTTTIATATISVATTTSIENHKSNNLDSPTIATTAAEVAAAAAAATPKQTIQTTPSTLKATNGKFHLKPILKVHEASNTRIIQVQPKQPEERPKLRLQLPQVARATELEEQQQQEQEDGDSEPVPILPKKTAPKSPQNANYVPVYSNKLVSSSSNYENMEFGRPIAPDSKPAITDPEETPMLMQLKLFKEQQQQMEQLQAPEEDLTPTAESKPIPGEDSNAGVAEDDEVEEDEAADEDDDEDESTACEEYTDDDIDEALAQDEEEAEEVSEHLDPENDKLKKEQEEEKELQQIYVNEPITPTDQQFDESHYLPMTPKKVELGQPGVLTLVSTHESYAEEEENHYVEMTKGIEDDDSKSNYEIMCLASTSTLKVTTKSEPVYMELAGVKPAPPPVEESHCSSGRSTLKKAKKSGSETLKKKTKKRQGKDMPDILKPAKSALALASDSSDADDESSRQQLEAKKLRSRSRFSLSDTFRPASYYLGASTPLNNYAESSDSEILPPPPIPDSPPPMEELKTEEIFSSEHYDTVKRRDSNSKVNLSYEQLPKMHASNTSLNLPKAAPSPTLKSSRLSLPDHFTKMRLTPQRLQVTTTPPQQHHARTLSDSNYSCQLTDNSSRTSSDLDLYRRRGQQQRCTSNNSLPLSSENESVEFRQRSDSELDRQRSRRPLSQESISEIESLSEQFEETLSSHELDTYLSHLHLPTGQATPTSHLLNDANAAAGADILTNLIKPPKTFRNAEDEEQHFYGNIHFLSSTDSIQQLGGGSGGLEQLPGGGAAAACLVALHSRNNSNISTQSAPYYYSELPTPPQLNNQRDIHAHGLNIAHIHNPIDRFNVDALVDKDQAIDSKNLYCMKDNNEKLSNKNLKLNNNQLADAVEPPDSSGSGSLNPSHSYLTTTKNTNLARKTIGGSDGNPNDGAGEDSDAGGGLGGGGGMGGVTTGKTPSNNVNPNLSVLGGELLWEEDALWRESLRRVSQRHARSLDDLDRITAAPVASTPKAKLSREVTYVNDSQKPRQPVQQQSLNEHDVYVQLLENASLSQDHNDSDVYEVLREETASNLSHKSNELDRETIRQWDAMSSGLMKSHHSNTETTGGHGGGVAGVAHLPLTSNVRSIIQQLNNSTTSNDDANGNPLASGGRSRNNNH